MIAVRLCTGAPGRDVPNGKVPVSKTGARKGLRVRVSLPPLMTITICGSMQFHEEMLKAKRSLEERGHIVHIPSGAYDKSKNEYYAGSEEEKVTFKIEHDLIHEHFREIDKAEAILVLNYEKKGIPGYVGGNTFLEMGYAFGQDKKIYLLHPIPDMDYQVEMRSMRPIVLDGDLSRLS